jgi:hypothetical protein
VFHLGPVLFLAQAAMPKPTRARAIHVFFMNFSSLDEPAREGSRPAGPPQGRIVPRFVSRAAAHLPIENQKELIDWLSFRPADLF